MARLIRVLRLIRIVRMVRVIRLVSCLGNMVWSILVYSGLER